MDPREHQRDVGEKEHFPRQERPESGRQDLKERAREKAGKNNKDRHEQTGRDRRRRTEVVGDDPTRPDMKIDPGGQVGVDGHSGGTADGTAMGTGGAGSETAGGGTGPDLGGGTTPSRTTRGRPLARP